VLRDGVEELFDAAHFAAGKGLERLRVDLENSVVELDGTVYPEKKKVVVLLHALIEGKGKASFAVVRQNNKDVFNKHEKLCDVLKMASPPVREKIRHGRGRDTMLQL
jgi:hypothetical protein